MHAERLSFIEKQSLRAWYTRSDAVAGDATAFDLGPMCRLGGDLLAMASWTRDGGTGCRRRAGFLTSSRGEAILSGTARPGRRLPPWCAGAVFKLTGRPALDLKLARPAWSPPALLALPACRSRLDRRRHGAVTDKIRTRTRPPTSSKLSGSQIIESASAAGSWYDRVELSAVPDEHGLAGAAVASQRRHRRCSVTRADAAVRAVPAGERGRHRPAGRDLQQRRARPAELRAAHKPGRTP